MTNGVTQLTTKGKGLAAALLLALVVGGAQAQSFLISDGPTVNSCTGNLYDSGGAGGDYGGSEDFTLTLCPSGGANSGLPTSVTFVSWSVQLLGAFDQLEIHDGTTTAAPTLAIGSGLVSLSGQTFTATNPSGCLTFHWTSDLLLTGAGWNATINTAPDAGLNGSNSVCSDGASFNLFNFLGGTPDAGGTWADPGSLAHSATYNPLVDVGGVYTYTVSGGSACSNATATVTVIENTAVDAGTNGSISVCSNELPFSLFGQLGGTPDNTGAWTGPGGVPVPGTYTPGTSVAGIYTYTVTAQPPCSNATATVTVTETAAPNAGSNATETVCSDAANFNMLLQLSGNPQAGGVWTRPNSTVHPNNIFNPGTDQPGDWTYTVLGTGPCADATAVLTIAVIDAPDAGSNGSITVCSTDASFTLLGELGGTPDNNGTWSGPGGAFGGTFTPGVHQAGVYTYTVPGQSPCAADVATVTVTVNNAPDAGGNASISKCSNDPIFSLFNTLTGTPDAGGTWAGPSPTTGNFNPATMLPGVYTYTRTGLAPCAAASATVTVSVSTAPDAGGNASVLVCSNDAAFGLIAELTGTPDNNGTWAAPGNVPHGNSFDPSSDPPGIYTYTVPGVAPCVPATATVTVTVTQAPDPGTSGTLTICSDGLSTPLLQFLSGADAGGTWTRPNGTSHPSGSYDPANVNHPAGVYTYTLTGASPCANAQSTVTVTENPAARAGTDGTITVCSNGSAFNLLTVLGNSPNGNGTWTAPGGGASNGTFIPGTSVAGQYRYVVIGLTPCINDTAFANVNVVAPPDPGTNGAVTVCSNGASFPLFGYLGGAPQNGGTWRNPLNQVVAGGNYVPGTSIPGIYTYTVTGSAPCANESAVVTVTQVNAPDAGGDDTRTVCSNMQPVNLFLELNGNPQSGGTWSGPGGAHSGTFIPGTDAAGVYTYTVAGTLPCSNDQATVTMVVNPAPNAGGNGAITVCEDVVLVDLFTALVGPYDAGGTWDDQDNTGQLNGSILNTGALNPGTYDFEYEVNGIGMCPDDHAHVDVTVVQQLDAGTNGADNACDTETNVDLFDALGGNPQSGGTWVQLSGIPAITGGFFNATVNGSGTYQFRYRLSGTATCDPDSATVTVNVVGGPNAGSNGVLNICSNGAAVPLITLLGNNPDAGGQWSGPGGNMNGVYDPVANAPGTYTYTVNGTPPCQADQSTVQVTETTAPNAGGSDVITVCSNAASFSMRDELNGTPATNGTWVGPGGTGVGNTFVPGVSPQGLYTYTVPGTAPCGSASSTLTISVSLAPFAGNDATYTTCSSAGQFVMVNQLGGSPQLGGTWTGPGGAINGIYDPAVNDPGIYIYSVPGLPPCSSDEATLEIFENDEADAGNSSAINVCSNGGSVILFNQFGGTPDLNGVWTDPNNQSFGGTFVPSQHIEGTYTYTVPGQFPCVSDQSTVDVVVNEAPDAGTSNSVVICSNQASFLLVDLLDDPQLGTWTNPNNQSFNGLFIPGTSLAGTYTYTVAGTGSCPPATSTVTVNVNVAPNAGQDGTLTVCSTGNSVNMLSVLVGEQTGGTWTRPGGLPHSGILLPGTNPSGVYTYTVAGQSPCNSDQSAVSVTINTAANAGISNDTTVCDNGDPFVLIDLLNGTPANGGTWYDPSNDVNPGIYIPGPVAEPGVYVYTVNGIAPCPTASSTITVIQNDAPNAGGDNTVTICSDQPAFQLLTQLSGGPDNNGQWSDPGSDPFGGLFIPGSSDPGTYTYFIDGAAPCPDDQSTVTILQNTAPDAGISTAVLVCSDEPAFLLIDRLAGSPMGGGTWSGGTNGLFIPGTSAAGTYTYTVTGAFPCGVAQASVQVTVIPAANAGANGNVTACVDDPGIDLFAELDGSPQLGGSWADDDNTGQLNNGSFDASGIAPGFYDFTYTVEGAGPCADDVATVTVEIVNALNAGNNTQVEVCDSETSVDLFGLMSGNAQAGGTWVDLDNCGALINGVFNAAQAGQGVWDFRYVLGASSQCDPDSAELTVTVLDGPNAGNDDAVQLCSTGANYDLNQGLGPGADGNGQWFTPTWLQHSSLLDPSVDPPGEWYYIAPAVGSCVADTSTTTVGISVAPVAGTSASITICNDTVPFSLNGVLQGEDAGGSWTFSGVGHSNVYNPAIDGTGTYIYQVNGQIPCAAAISTVSVTENNAPNAGNNTSLNWCSNDPGFSLISQLPGNPDPGGIWLSPGGGAHGPVFNPAADISGTYTYVVSGSAPCVNDTATLFIQNTQAPNAGDDANVNACLSEICVDLLDALGGTPDANGTWTDLDATGAVSGNCFNATLVTVGSYDFRYVVPTAGICDPDTNYVTVNVVIGADPGIGDTLLVCGGNVAFDLFPTLGGTPQTGGTWTDLMGTGTLTGSTVDVSGLPQGGPYAFSYTVTSLDCGDVSTVVLIQPTPYPDPGGDSSIVVCSTGTAFALAEQLAGTPENGGVWTAPGGGSSNGNFIPGVDAPGAYTYLVAGTAPCSDSSATVLVVVNQPPDAGINGLLITCDSTTALDLFTGLNGTPQPGGTWADDDNTGGLTGGLFDATGSAPGDYDFTYTVAAEGCAEDDALVKVTVVGSVDVIAVQTTCNEQDRTYAVRFTIQNGDPGSYIVTGITGTLSSSAPFTFESDPLFDSQAYSITIDDQYGCGAVTITGVSPCGFEEEVFVPESFSPNGDDTNEQFIIPGIEGYPGNSIIIFNRWGNEVYKSSGYDNSSIVWDGTSNTALIPGQLPAGTYYYVLELTSGSEAIRGYVYLNR
ncbi:MAG: gliding motility-associated C-terminal domain-containing protein [Flavobacteriales bacterium]|nr:gliding motility-associated C-terminal domain-containing protein [Flavobacteriales bacterium]